MARAINLDDFLYEIDDAPKDGSAATVVDTCLIRMDKFNVNASDPKKIKAPNASGVGIAFHVTLRKNKNEFGIHPRYLVGELVLASTASACYETQPKRTVFIPVLTLAQFNTFKVFDKKGAAQQNDTIISVSHSANGTTNIDYKIIAKVAQRLV